MRLDTYLFENGYFESREKAKKALLDKRVCINGKTVIKPSYMVGENDSVAVLQTEKTEYVGRGGIKLEYALDSFSIDVAGKRAIDIGASTGGFTDCLIKRSARYVYAVDIGHGQLHHSLVNDARVKNLEGINARELTEEIVENERVDIAVSDLSFISQKLVIPVVKNVLSVGGVYVLLIKPQFEAGKENIGKNGIVKSEKVRQKVVEDILKFTENEGYDIVGVTRSPIEGGSGNVEYLAAFRRVR